MNPFLWIFPISFSIPLLAEFRQMPDYHPSLGLLLSDYNQFLICMIGAMVLLPEAFYFGSAAASNVGGTEFLLTRAVDRPLVYRSRAANYLLLVSAVPALLTFHALFRPDAQVGEYSRTLHDAVLAGLPGSTSAPVGAHGELKPILIPGGNVMVHAWHMGTNLLIVMAVELTMFLVLPLAGRFQRWVFWGLILGVGFLPILEPLKSLADSMHEKVPYSEQFFFWYANHLVLYWGGMLVCVCALQLWCERRFARMEF